jgi:hypothetical protein
MINDCVLTHHLSFLISHLPLRTPSFHNPSADLSLLCLVLSSHSALLVELVSGYWVVSLVLVISLSMLPACGDVS